MSPLTGLNRFFRGEVVLTRAAIRKLEETDAERSAHEFLPWDTPLRPVDQLRELEPELLEAVTRVLRSGQVINGPEVAQFEQAAARYCGGPRHRLLIRVGRAPLLALARGVGPGGIILPPFTFFASVGASLGWARGRCSPTSRRPPTTSTRTRSRARLRSHEGDHAGAPVRPVR